MLYRFCYGWDQFHNTSPILVLWLSFTTAMAFQWVYPMENMWKYCSQIERKMLHLGMSRSMIFLILTNITDPMVPEISEFSDLLQKIGSVHLHTFSLVDVYFPFWREGVGWS